MTLDEFIAKHQFRSEVYRLKDRPTASEDWPIDSRHWTVQLMIPNPIRDGYLTHDVQYTQGPAHKIPPSTYDVLDCLRSDFQYVIHGETFEDFADEFGYDPDSRKAECIYRACQKEAEEFRLAFGEAILKELAEEVEPE